MLAQLRALMAQENLQGYILPSTDEFQNEFIVDEANRLKLVTGFSGSNGLLVLLQKNALFFTDGRYLEQAAKQLDSTEFKIFDLREIKNFPWVNYLGDGDFIGYDPLLFTKRSIKVFADLKLKPTPHLRINLKPSIQGDVCIYHVEYAGQGAHDKIMQLKHNLSYALITDTSFICFLLNLRSKSASTIGMFNCYLTIAPYEINLFTDVSLDHTVIKYLAELGVVVKVVDHLLPYLQSCAAESFIVDEETCPIAFLSVLYNAQHNNSYKFQQACKQPLEICNFQKAHINDGIVLCELLAWSEEAQGINEFDLSNKLIDLRKRYDEYVKESFYAICGFQENSSIIHYRPLEQTAKRIAGAGMLLVDTGGHYLGGTTDVTRTIYIGEPTSEHKKFYTLVLKGHINLARIKFKKGCSGQHLDVLARAALWQNFADYPHGTGHGVGNFLNVHEGPQGISLFNQAELKPGMILSNEPGYYEAGHFGIRLENLMYVKETKVPGFLEFETLTLVPFASKLINFNLLTHEELGWLKEYYARIESLILPSLSETASKYLEKELCAINVL